MSPYAESHGGWRLPTPHEAFTTMFVIVEALRESGMFAPTSGMGRVLALLATAAAIVGVSAARSHVSPRIRAILEERDRRLSEPTE